MPFASTYLDLFYEVVIGVAQVAPDTYRMTWESNGGLDSHELNGAAVQRLIDTGTIAPVLSVAEWIASDDAPLAGLVIEGRVLTV